ncbi:O-antigen polymerase [Raineyella sp.]|uniref:Oligosaccharide repeat unit polymerase n=1 Tax=bioreactor metagenome TaxID=1076179 RepID=A0A644Y0I2_9ZZZZ|nr:O-antigen polymerase [Raineyella sp.]MEA5153342.1 O-antigen polymerase [Raineyella sp.]
MTEYSLSHPSSPVRPVHDGLSVLFTLAVGIVLSAVVPVLLLDLNSDGRPAPWPLLGVLMLSGVLFTRAALGGERRLHEMVVWLYTYGFMGVAPVVQVELASLPGTTPSIDTSLVPTAGLLVLAGMVSFMVGGIVGQRGASAPVSVRGVDGRRTQVLTFLSCLVAAYYLVRVGPANLFTSRMHLESVRAGIWGDSPLGAIVYASTIMGLLVSFTAQMRLRWQEKQAGRTSLPLLPALTLIALLVCANPISTARYVFGTVALGVLGAFGAYRTIRGYRIISFLALLGLFFIFPVLDAFRYTTSGDRISLSLLSALAGGDFDSFAQVINALTYVRDMGVTWGHQMLGVVLFWVPRSLWSGKPLDSGPLLAVHQGYGFTNLSAPLWAEFYLNWGWVGVIGGMFLFGMWVRRADQRANILLGRSPVPGPWTAIIPFYLLIVLRGSLLQAMTYLVIVVIGGWFVRQGAQSRVD